MLDDVAGPPPSEARARIRDAYLADETKTVEALIARADLGSEVRHATTARARRIVEHIRGAGRNGSLMESFLNEYGLSNEEGIALMCLAEAMLRVPDTHTLDALIQDKIGPADWQRHLGHSESIFVNASSWGLMLAGRIVRQDDERLRGHILSVVRNLGEPVIRAAVSRSMELLGEQFVLGRTIEEALNRAVDFEDDGYRFSYDMLGEAALTKQDAKRYFLSYGHAIAEIARRCGGAGPAQNPGISVKLSALHPRYEYAKRGRVLDELSARLQALAIHAKNANMGLNVDAEEADRLELSLDVIEAVSASPDLKGWDGFGVVVQAYQKRAPHVIDWLADVAHRHERRFMVRLVKGAYWDSEIKRHQELGLEGYPVFTRKTSTDVSYLACAKALLAQPEVFYPQFATHNAHTVAAVIELAGGSREFEFQRLQGMGEALHAWIVEHEGLPTRIYAPVGVHKDLLAYLVRRLLENGANSSFVNQIVDDTVPVEALIADPVAHVQQAASIPHPRIPLPADLYGLERRNSQGLNLADPLSLGRLRAELEPFAAQRWTAAPIVCGHAEPGSALDITNPADRSDVVGQVTEASAEAIGAAVEAAGAGFTTWSVEPASARADRLRAAAALYEAHRAELMALCVREAGKTYLDAVAEVREAVDFLRYYAVQAEALETRGDRHPLGVFACISPWNFPLAIFTGQIAAALASGNAVVAKPAEQTPLIAARAVALLHQAGIPREALHLLPGDGESVGAPLTADPRIAGVCFTGSTAAAQAIRRAMVSAGNGAAPLIAETGGVNCMIVDSTALPEQAVKDVVTSAFQSAGQRCSALRLLYVQEDVAEVITEMLAGAMAELRVGNPALLQTDVGPVIDEEARGRIAAHVDAMKREAALIHECHLAPESAPGTFVAPVAFTLEDGRQLQDEIFGPVLHVARFTAERLDAVVDDINAKGYGLTLGVHSRITSTVDRVASRACIGNIYVNRNQIGAVVGVQPFGGERLSGTGPKAGGPHYLLAFTRAAEPPARSVDLESAPLTPPSPPAGGRGLRRVGAAKAAPYPELGERGELQRVAHPRPEWHDALARARSLQAVWDRRNDRHAVLARAADAMDSPQAAADVRAVAAWAEVECSEPLTLRGPTGEQNQLSLHGRGIILCLGDGRGADAVTLRQAAWALAAGNGVAAPLSDDIQARLAAAGIPAALLVRLPDGFDATALTAADLLAAVDGIAIEDNPALVDAVAAAAANREGPILTVVSAPDQYYRYATERSLSINTTAAGGNASLLALTN